MLLTSSPIHAPLVAASLWLASGAVLAAELANFHGTWRAVALEAEATPEVDPAMLDLQIEPADGGGFRARWVLMEPAADGGTQPRRVRAHFEPTDRPGVFAFREEKGSFLGRFFASPETGNPLARETLLWARLGDDALILYSLTVDEAGDPILSRAAHLLDDDGLRASRSFRSGADAPRLVEGRLERTGG
jgi:hypothetical protein